MNLLALGTMILSVAAGATTINNNFDAAIENKNARTILTTLGPGIINENHKDAKDPETRKNINNNRNVEFRGSNNDYFLMLNPADCSYMDMGFNVTLDAYWDGTTFTGNDAHRFNNTDLEKIKLYRSKTLSYTLKQVLKEGKSVVINQFGDHIVNISFAIDNIFFSNPGQVYKFVIEEGFQYPIGGSETNYQQKEKLSLINCTYGDSSHELIYATHWLKEKNMDDDEEYVPIGVGSRDEINYRIHFRTNQKGDDYCSLILFFDAEVYSPEINKARGNPQYNIPIGDTYFDKQFYIDNLYKKIHFTKLVNGEPKKVDLYDVADMSSNPTYNLFGEEGALGFRLKAHDGNVYNAFTTVTIESGCIFPCYGTTNGELNKYRFYEQFTTISFNATSPSAEHEWSVHFERMFKLGEVSIKSFIAENITFTDGESTFTKPFITIELNESIFEDIEEKTNCSLYFDQNILHSIFVNGHSLNYLNKDAKTYCLMNSNGEGNSYSLSVEGVSNASEISNIIVNNLTSNITMHCSDPSVKTVYGECPYYKLVDSASFTKNGSEYVKDKEIIYTVWFDGANPIKVNGKRAGDIVIYRWDTANKPADPTKPHAIFNYWVDERGNKLEDGNPQINGSVDYTSDWTNLYEVKLDLGDKVVTFTDVKHGARLSSLEAAKQYLNPTKKGYFLDKWVDENGYEYSLDNKIYSDITLKAVWVELKGSESGGCGGSILAVTGVTSLVAIAGATLLIFKKKRDAEQE